MRKRHFSLCSIIVLLSLFVSCNDTGASITTIYPVDSFTIEISSKYEQVNLNYYNKENKDTIITFNSESPAFHLYTKDSVHKAYKLYKEINVENSPLISLEFASFRRVSNDLFILVLMSSNVLIKYDSSLNPIDTIFFNHKIDKLSEKFSIMNINSDRIRVLNDSVLFFRISTKEKKNLKDVNPYVFYDYKNDMVIKNNFQWYMSDYVSRSQNFFIWPNSTQLNSEILCFTQPHSDSLIIYNWKTDERKSILMNNIFFTFPDNSLFKNKDNITVDRDKYYRESFLNIGLFAYDGNIYSLFSKPEKDKFAMNNIHIMGLNYTDKEQRYFRFPYDYQIQLACVYNDNELLIPIREEQTDLSTEQKPVKYHIYNLSEFDF